jgi:signal transduction histidine kinase
LADFIADIQVAAQLEAETCGCSLTVLPVPTGLALRADRQMLASAVANLLQNAFKLGGRDHHVWLRVHAAADRALIEIEHECGGVPPGTVDVLSNAFDQRSVDRSGLGLGLFIAQRSIEANGGILRARDLPDTGCVLTIDLPIALAARHDVQNHLAVLRGRVGALELA